MVKTFPPLTESKISLPVSQQPATNPIVNELNSVHTFSTCFFKIHFNFVLLSSRSPKWALPFKFSNKYFVLLPTSPMRAISFDHPIPPGLVVLTFPGDPHYVTFQFSSLTPKYSAQNFVINIFNACYTRKMRVVHVRLTEHQAVKEYCGVEV
jgi:hypothetical protein